MIKHHNYFKVHLPKKDYKAEAENELTEILMEEFYLFSEGKWTTNYESINPKHDKFEVSLYPSILYALNKLHYSENEKFHFINNYLDNAFVDYLERFNPIYKCEKFIEYHLYYYKGSKEDFYNHIKFQILPMIKKRKEDNKSEFDYETLEKVVKNWINTKMKKNKRNISNSTKINNAENVFVNNQSNVKKQYGNTLPKDKVALYSFIVAIIGIVIAMIIGWDEIIKFLEKF